MASVEQLSMAQLARLAKDVVPYYDLILDGKGVDIDGEILGMFDAADEISAYYRRRIEACINTILDIESYKEDTPEVDDQYRPPGYRGSWMDD